MGMDENRWDRLLHIRTSGRDDTGADQYRYPYEPTPYAVLERLANSGYIRKDNVLIDYGCGKGRVGFFLSYHTRCRSIGIEYENRIYQAACQNQKTAVSGKRTEFLHENAERYALPESADRLFFFNPFSKEILQKVLGRVRESYYACPRKIQLFFYYPSEKYEACLREEAELSRIDEIDCKDLFDGENPRERIVIYEMGGCF